MKIIHILCETFDGDLRSSSFVRLIQPLTYPCNAAHFRISQGPEYQAAEIIIVERTWLQDLGKAEQLVDLARRDGACLIYSIDDHLLAIGRDGASGKRPLPDQNVRLVELLARASDGVIVSTDPLKRRMLFFNNTVITVPNAIDDRLLEGASGWSHSPRRRRAGRWVAGYMGTSTHDSDLLMAAEGLSRSLRKYEGLLELELVGVVSDTSTLKVFEGLPVRVRRTGDAVDYPVFMRWMAENVQWDFAIAPLEDTEFNRCKSDIKFLDYSALRIPGVYSRTAPYEDSVAHLETGYLVENRPSSWAEAIDFMVSDDERRTELAERAREHVWARRTLEQNASRWRQAILAIAQGHRGSMARMSEPYDFHHRSYIDRIRRVVAGAVPRGATVLVTVRGGGEPLELGPRLVWRFPRPEGSGRPGESPENGRSLISHLEDFRSLGAGYLVVPAPSFWWLDHNRDFRRHVEDRYSVLAREGSCIVYSLSPRAL